MMWLDFYDGWTWLVMAAMMVLFWSGVATLIVFVVRAATGPRGGDQTMDVLRRRLGSGEITQEELEKTRRVLQR